MFFIHVRSILLLTYHFHVHVISTSSINRCCHSDFTGIITGSFETYVMQFDCRAILRELKEEQRYVNLDYGTQRD